jgi:tRNA(Arg) A34 adenosine deaminase TadA
MTNNHKAWMQMAIDLSLEGMNNNEGGPFGAIVVKDGKIIGKGNNKVTSGSDPTAHAEIIAIRDACKYLNSFQLDDCIMYTSCEPCPMCLGAIYWARPKKVYYANSKQDAATIGFDDDFIYKELELPLHKRQIPFEQTGRDEALKVFKAWNDKSDKIEY